MPSAETTSDSRVVAVTGATGFVGRHVVDELLRRGHRVRALSRSRERWNVLPEGDITHVLGDVFDEQSMDRLAEGADAFIHLIGIRREQSGGVTFKRLHVDATRAAIGAATRSGVSRYIQMSALGTRPEARSDYHKTKWAAEQLVRDSNLQWTIMRPSVILGPDGEFMDMAMGWARGEEPPKRFLPYFAKPIPMVGERVPDSADRSATVQPVSVRDVAAAFASAIERDDAIGETYPVVGPQPMTWPQLLVLVRDATPGANRKLQPFGIPAEIASAVALGFQKIGLGSLLPFGPSEPLMAAEDNAGTPAKVSAHLGVTPEPFRETLSWCVAH
jgi:NADH dehydrogenase